MNRAFTAALCGGLALAATPGFAAENVVGHAVQRLHLTPQQLLSLRDFLGAFNHGTEVEASEAGVFILRDSAAMTYSGEFSLRLRSDGALQVDRVSGAATLDFSRTVQMPFRLLAKARAQAVSVLAGSQATAAATASAALPAPQIAGLKFTGADAAGILAQSRAVFYADGSGTIASVRAAGGDPPAPTRFTLRYYQPVRSDSAHAWRDAVLEFDSDVPLRMAELENRYSCAGVCGTVRMAAPSQATFHMMRWQHELIAAVPPGLLAQLAPPPVMPTTAAALAPDATAPQDGSPPETPPAQPPQL